MTVFARMGPQMREQLIGILAAIAYSLGMGLFLLIESIDFTQYVADSL